MRELQLAYSRHEKIVRIIKNLEKKRQQGQIQEHDFQKFLGQYKSLQQDARANVHEIRQHLKEEQARVLEQQKTAESELKKIRMRARQGQIAPQDVPGVMREVQNQYEQTSKQTHQLAEALAAKTPQAHGGYIADVDIKKRIEYRAQTEPEPLAGIADYAEEDEWEWNIASMDAASQNTPAPPEPQSTPVPATTPAGQNIFVTVPSTFAAPSSYIGPTNINIVLLVVLGLIHLSVPYFYMGQTGKGVVFLILDFVFWPMMVASTCGMGSILYIPYKSILLTDALVVASRIKKGPIHPWRFF